MSREEEEPSDLQATAAALGAEIVHVPYKGQPPALQDLIGGQIDAAVASLGNVNRYPGKIKPLAVASATRFPSHPDVPTFAEEGLTPLHAPSWMGLAFASGVANDGFVERCVDGLFNQASRRVLGSAQSDDGLAQRVLNVRKADLRERSA